MLELHHVDAFYGKAQVLFGVSLRVAAGEVMALLGRNGAGKSTVLKTVLGLGPSLRGRIVFDGREIGGLTTAAIVRLGIGYVPEDRRVFSSLTVAENLIVGERRGTDRAAANGGWTRSRLLAMFPNLAGLLDRPAGRISGGEQQMLTIARTLIGNPRLIMLDEPSEGLAPRIVEGLAEAIMTMKRQGLGVLLAEQNLLVARAVADYACIIENGRIRRRGRISELLADEAALRAHLAL